MDSCAGRDANECIEHIRLSATPSEFGYKIQALAAHVLLRLGYQIIAVNRLGHPDIVAIRHGMEFRFEVEAEVTDPRPRKLTDDDIDSLTNSSGVLGYYALAVSFPTPRWVLVPAEKLIGRMSSPNMLLEALSDTEYSTEWTNEFTTLLRDSCQQARQASFRVLCERALTGRGL